jgi:hypothetical protein
MDLVENGKREASRERQAERGKHSRQAERGNQREARTAGKQSLMFKSPAVALALHERFIL